VYESDVRILPSRNARPRFGLVTLRPTTLLAVPTAIVTGAATGIGAAIAQRLARDGFAIAVADIDAARAGERAAALRVAGHTAHAVTVDVADASSVAAMVEAVRSSSATIDVLVNNAGITGPHHAFVDYPREAMLQVIAIDLIGTMQCTQAVLPAMLTHGAGRIVNIASIAGKDGNPSLAPYAAAKAGIIAFTKSLGRELAASGIAVNAVAPGGVGGTDIARGLGPAARPTGAQVATGTPMGRLARPDEIAALVSWLCSPECSYSTGAVYDISGGRATY
jgi:3-oxoacyl-[acyl-carrier protein] reductase